MTRLWRFVRSLSPRRGWGEPFADKKNGRVMLRPERSARLHLGCGDVYLPGYLNVDYPPDLGVASGTSRPDLEAAIPTLDCPEGALAEVRLHHVFEHFERAVGLALLVRWFDWLEPRGLITIETPDFESSVDCFAEKSFDDQSLILRHVFGSQEASWANHLDGWSAHRFRRILPLLGFENVETEATVSDTRGCWSTSSLARQSRMSLCLAKTGGLPQS